MSGQETEVKFLVGSLEKIKQRLIHAGAEMIHARVLEINLRFDTPDRSLRRAGKVLRLRRDHAVRFTFKGPGVRSGNVVSRRELELELSDFEIAREFLTSLGYEILIVYEKFRTTYAFGNSHIMLDELPFGDFVEIEGVDAAGIQHAATELGLDWEAAIPTSYHALFEQIAAIHNLDPKQATFSALGEMKFSAGEMHIRLAD